MQGQRAEGDQQRRHATAINVLAMSSVLRTTHTPATRPRITRIASTMATRLFHCHSWSKARNSPAPNATARIDCRAIQAVQHQPAARRLSS